MLVRIYDLEPARAGGVIHIGSSQKERLVGLWWTVSILQAQAPAQIRSPLPLPDSLSCQGRHPWTWALGLGIPAKGSWGAVTQGPAIPGGPGPLRNPYPHFLSTLGLLKSKRLEKGSWVRGFWGSRSGLAETAEGVQMGFFLLINPKLIWYRDIGWTCFELTKRGWWDKWREQWKLLFSPYYFGGGGGGGGELAITRTRMSPDFMIFSFCVTKRSNQWVAIKP